MSLSEPRVVAEVRDDVRPGREGVDVHVERRSGGARSRLRGHISIYIYIYIYISLFIYLYIYVIICFLYIYIYIL